MTVDPFLGPIVPTFESTRVGVDSNLERVDSSMSLRSIIFRKIQNSIKVILMTLNKDESRKFGWIEFDLHWIDLSLGKRGIEGWGSLI